MEPFACMFMPNRSPAPLQPQTQAESRNKRGHICGHRQREESQVARLLAAGRMMRETSLFFLGDRSKSKPERIKLGICWIQNCCVFIQH